MKLNQYRKFRKRLKLELSKNITMYENESILHPEEVYDFNRDKALLFRLSNHSRMPLAFKQYLKCLIHCNYFNWRAFKQYL